MGGREMRALLLFVLASLAVGWAIRGWPQRDGPTLIERLRGVEEEALLDEEQDGRHSAADPTGEADTPPEGGDVRARRAPDRPRGSRALPLGLLDPDQATAEEWERLPGIGPALAARIVADRAARGPFGGAEGLARVRGIGPKTVARLRPYLRRASADSLSPNAN